MADGSANDDARWSRRKVLSARGLGASAGGLLGVLMPNVPFESDNPQRTLSTICYARRAMACEFSVYLPPITEQGMAAAEAALDDIQKTEEQLTVFSASSALSYVNQNAANGPVRVDKSIYQLLERSAVLTGQTEGAFDIAVGALIRAWGFVDGSKRVPSEAQRLSALNHSGQRHIELDPENRTVRFRVPGVEINPGSIGKGYAIDRAVRHMREQYDIQCVLMQGGLSSVYALGSPADDGRGWLIGIQNPDDTTRRLATVHLRNRALATSGASRQYFESGGQRFGHVLDPRTGWPADTLASATVLARDAATADALATALFVMGLDKASDLCKNRPDIAALLVLNPGQQGGTSAQPKVVTFNLTASDVDLDANDD